MISHLISKLYLYEEKMFQRQLVQERKWKDELQDFHGAPLTLTPSGQPAAYTLMVALLLLTETQGIAEGLRVKSGEETVRIAGLVDTAAVAEVVSSSSLSSGLKVTNCAGPLLSCVQPLT